MKWISFICWIVLAAASHAEVSEGQWAAFVEAADRNRPLEQKSIRDDLENLRLAYRDTHNDQSMPPAARRQKLADLRYKQDVLRQRQRDIAERRVWPRVPLFPINSTPDVGHLLTKHGGTVIVTKVISESESICHIAYQYAGAEYTNETARVLAHNRPSLIELNGKTHILIREKTRPFLLRHPTAGWLNQTAVLLDGGFLHAGVEMGPFGDPIDVFEAVDLATVARRFEASTKRPGSADFE